MKKIEITKNSFCHLIVLALFFSIINTVNAQNEINTKKLTSAKEVIERYNQVIGQSDKPNVTYFSKKTIRITNMVTNYLSEEIHSKIINIELVDYNDEVIAFINASSSKFGKNISRQLLTKENSYIFMENGSEIVNPSFLTPDLFERSYVLKEDDSINEKPLLPNEIFDDEEVYVIQYNDTMKIALTETSIKKYAYYSISSGLLIGIKSVTFGSIESIETYIDDISSSSIGYTYFKDYKEVDGVLRPHKIIVTQGINASSTQVESGNTMKTTSLIEYNVDTEHFKNVTFKNPEKAIAEIPDEF